MSDAVFYPDAKEPPMANRGIDEMEQVTLCEALDRILNKGAVITGDLMISVADVDLIYLGLRCILTSIETARGTLTEAEPGMARDALKIAAGCGMELSHAGQ
jgi:hypothetical protein